MLVIPGPTSPCIVKNFVVALNFTWALELPRTLESNTSPWAPHRSKTKPGSQLFGKVVLWLYPNWLKLGHLLPVWALLQPGARVGLLRAPLVWVKPIWWVRSLLPCSRVLAVTHSVFIITTTALRLLICLLCKKQSGTFKKEKGGNEKTLKLLNSLQTIRKNLRAINLWDRIKEKN